jgi:Protein of unknown function (DUF2975)
MKNFQNKSKIIKVSKIIRNILFAGLVLWIGAGVPAALTLIIDLSLPGKTDMPVTVYLKIGLIIMVVFGFIVNLKLFRFFDRLKNGHLFDVQTVSNLDAAGKWWILLWLFEVLYHEIGHGIFQVSDVWGSGGLFAGLALIFVAWLLKEAQELQEDQELTV